VQPTAEGTREHTVRKRAEQERYERQAAVGRGMGPSGSDFFHPALRGPYLFVEDWLRGRCQGATLLDYGSGQGIHSVAPAKYGGDVVQLDISPASLLAGAHRARQESVLSRCRPVAGDCERLPFEDATFDIIISSGTFSCLDLQAACSELVRVLKPEGHLIAVDTLGHNPLLNARRRLRGVRGERTRWEVEHVLRLQDLETMKRFFRCAEIHHFDLLTLACTFRPFERLLPLARKIDRCLLRTPLFRPFAFKFVAILSEPRS